MAYLGQPGLAILHHRSFSINLCPSHPPGTEHLFHIVFQRCNPSFPWSTSGSLSHHLQPSASLHPIIIPFSLHMPEPSQSISPAHITDWFHPNPGSEFFTGKEPCLSDTPHIHLIILISVVSSMDSYKNTASYKLLSTVNRLLQYFMRV
jgi:hypothetical protein